MYQTLGPFGPFLGLVWLTCSGVPAKKSISKVQCSTVCVVVKTTLNNIAMKHIEATILLLRFCRGLARFLRFSRSRWCSEKTQPTLASSSSSYYVPTLPTYSIV